MFDVGGGELLFILIAILLLFGPSKLPELARSFGKGMAQFRRAQADLQRNINVLSDEINESVQIVTKEQTAVTTYTRELEPATGTGGAETETSTEAIVPSATTAITLAPSEAVVLSPQSQHLQGETSGQEGAELPPAPLQIRPAEHIIARNESGTVRTFGTPPQSSDADPAFGEAHRNPTL